MLFITKLIKSQFFSFDLRIQKVNLQKSEVMTLCVWSVINQVGTVGAVGKSVGKSVDKSVGKSVGKSVDKSVD